MALSDLKKAIDLDEKYKNIAKADKDFRKLRKNKNFKKLVE
jgi:hypothetical protein